MRLLLSIWTLAAEKPRCLWHSLFVKLTKESRRREVIHKMRRELRRKFVCLSIPSDTQNDLIVVLRYPNKTEAISSMAKKHLLLPLSDPRRAVFLTGVSAVASANRPLDNKTYAVRAATC